MTTIFENYGRFYPVLFFNDANSIDYYTEGGIPYTLRECMNFIEYRTSYDNNCCGAAICDWDTGEVVVTFDCTDNAR